MEFDYTKIIDWFKKNVGFLIIFGILVIRVFTSFIDIEPSGKDILAIIGDCLFNGGLMLIVGILMQKQGQITGLESKEIADTIEAHKKQCEAVIPISSWLAKWCVEKNEKDLESIRKTILANEDIKWEEFLSRKYAVTSLVSVTQVNSDGKKVRVKTLITKIVDEGELKGRKKRAVRRARRAKITPLSETMLTTAIITKTKDPHRMGRSISEYDVQKTSTNIFMKIAFAVMLGGFMPTFIEGVTPAEIIWSGVSVMVYAALGILSYLDAKHFIKTEYKANFDIKTRYLKEYEIYIKNNVRPVNEEDINEEKTEAKAMMLPPPGAYRLEKSQLSVNKGGFGTNGNQTEVYKGV